MSKLRALTEVQSIGEAMVKSGGAIFREVVLVTVQVEYLGSDAMEREEEMGVISFFYYFGEENADEYLDAPFYNGSRWMCSGCVAFECTRSCVSTSGSFRARHVVPRSLARYIQVPPEESGHLCGMNEGIGLGLQR